MRNEYINVCKVQKDTLVVNLADPLVTKKTWEKISGLQGTRTRDLEILAGAMLLPAKLL